MNVSLPPLPSPDLLADLCQEAAAREHLQPASVEKDFYLTRLIWALAQHFGDRLLLKGGTLLSKVDLGFRRMSEDVDLVIPWDRPRSHKGVNATQLNRVRDALKKIAPMVGLTFVHYDGERHERNSQVLWKLPYGSTFGRQEIHLETSLRPILRPPRRAPLGQLLQDPLIGTYEEAYCWALDEDEARAEKVRAAFTREAIRDFYDLDELAKASKDFTSKSFERLVDLKLAELKAPPLGAVSAPFALTQDRRERLELSLKKDLPGVLRTNAAQFDLQAMLTRFGRIWQI